MQPAVQAPGERRPSFADETWLRPLVADQTGALFGNGMGLFPERGRTRDVFVCVRGAGNMPCGRPGFAGGWTGRQSGRATPAVTHWDDEMGLGAVMGSWKPARRAAAKVWALVVLVAAV